MLSIEDHWSARDGGSFWIGINRWTLFSRWWIKLLLQNHNIICTLSKRCCVPFKGVLEVNWTGGWYFLLLLLQVEDGDTIMRRDPLLLLQLLHLLVDSTSDASSAAAVVERWQRTWFRWILFNIIIFKARQKMRRGDVEDEEKVSLQRRVWINNMNQSLFFGWEFVFHIKQSVIAILFESHCHYDGVDCGDSNVPLLTERMAEWNWNLVPVIFHIEPPPPPP